MDLTKVTKTTGGHSIKDLRFNERANMYLGKVLDPLWAHIKDANGNPKWITASWKKNGQCTNTSRDDMKLKL